MLLKLIIRLYWWLIPPGKRNACIFRESCSRHVYRIADNNGFFKGLHALLYRVRACRAPYELSGLDKGGKELKLCTGQILKEKEISLKMLD